MKDTNFRFNYSDPNEIEIADELSKVMEALDNLFARILTLDETNYNGLFRTVLDSLKSVCQKYEDDLDEV